MFNAHQKDFLIICDIVIFEKDSLSILFYIEFQCMFWFIIPDQSYLAVQNYD